MENSTSFPHGKFARKSASPRNLDRGKGLEGSHFAPLDGEDWEENLEEKCERGIGYEI